MFAYTAKSFSLAHDFRHAMRILASKNVKASMRGMTMRTTATPDEVRTAITEAYKAYGY
jgi:hypothetical protein